MRHFHEKLEQEHEIRLSYTWVKKALQGAGLVRAERQRGVHRRRRERRPLPGMMLHRTVAHLASPTCLPEERIFLRTFLKSQYTQFMRLRLEIQ